MGLGLTTFDLPIPGRSWDWKAWVLGVTKRLRCDWYWEWRPRWCVQCTMW